MGSRMKSWILGMMLAAFGAMGVASGQPPAASNPAPAQPVVITNPNWLVKPTTADLERVWPTDGGDPVDGEPISVPIAFDAPGGDAP